MPPDYIILLVVTVICMSGGLLLLREAKKYQARRYVTEICNHDWQQDGQAMQSIRWTCTKCGKNKFEGCCE